MLCQAFSFFILPGAEEYVKKHRFCLYFEWNNLFSVDFSALIQNKKTFHLLFIHLILFLACF